VAAVRHLEPQRILVVDDNVDAADMLRDVLVARGHDVQVAYNGPDALDLAMSFRPQVALLDIGMNDMDGHELAGRLRREPTTAEMLLVAVTGWGQEEDQRRAIAAGFDAHLTKPADADAIVALIAQRTVTSDRATGGTTRNQLTSR
jgi:CheY-like chemotaxis protein